MHQYATLEDTIYFGFGANLTTGAAGDGATPLYDVRLAGAAASAIPTLSGTPTLLTHANYTDGCYEVAIAATAANGFAAGNTYLVFVTLTISAVTPAACIGSFRLAPVPANNTQWLGTASPALVGGRLDASVGAMAANVITDAATAADMTAVIADAVWNAATATYGAAGSYGLLTETNLDATVGSRLATAGYTAPDNSTIGLIAGYTDSIESRLPASLVGGRMDVSIGAIANDTGSVTKLERVLSGNTTGTVGAASTTTSIVTSALDPAANVADQYKGLILKFDDATTTVALRGQGTDITASTAGGVLTVTALTTAPVSGDIFTVS